MIFKSPAVLRGFFIDVMSSGVLFCAMEIVLQEAGHVSAFLVSEYTPAVNALLSPEHEFKPDEEISWDVLSFRPPSFDCAKWRVEPVKPPRRFDRNERQQTLKFRGSVEATTEKWAKGRLMSAYVSFQLPSAKLFPAINIRKDFSCVTGVLACLHAMGLSLDGIRTDAGIEYDFSQIGLDF